MGYVINISSYNMTKQMTISLEVKSTEKSMFTSV